MKLTKCEEGEWGENCHHEVTYFLNSHMFKFVIFLSHCFILRESDFLREN